MRIAVLGAGAGGTTLAFDYAAHGHEVSLFDFLQFPGNIVAISEQRGINVDGDISGFSFQHASNVVTGIRDAAEAC